MNVAERGVPVTKISDLFLVQAIQAVVTPTHVALLVLPLRVDDTSNCQNQHAALTCQIDGVTGRIFRRILGNVCPGRENTTSGTECNDVCGRDCAYGWIASVVSSPSEKAWAAGERADRYQKDASISHIGIVDPSEDSEAGNRGNREYGQVYSTTVGFIAEKRDTYGNKTRAYVRRYGVELSFGSCPAKVSQDCGLQTRISE